MDICGGSFVTPPQAVPGVVRSIPAYEGQSPEEEITDAVHTMYNIPHYVYCGLHHGSLIGQVCIAGLSDHDYLLYPSDLICSSFLV